MLILGGRYGSIEPTTGASYTELEYDYAIEKGKRFFSVVMTEEALEAKVKTGGSHNLERENPKQLNAFRKKVLSKTSSFFTDEKDIRLSVYESILDFAEDPALKGWIEADGIEDTADLKLQVASLTQESIELKEKIKNLQEETTTRATAPKHPAFDQIIEIFEALKHPTPIGLHRIKAQATTVSDVMLLYRDFLIKGIDRNRTAEEEIIFTQYFVDPEMQNFIHSKSKNAFSISDRAKEFINYCTLRMIRSTNEDSAGAS